VSCTDPFHFPRVCSGALPLVPVRSTRMHGSWDALSETSLTKGDGAAFLVSLVDRGPVRASVVHPAGVERSATEVKLAAWAPQERQLFGAHAALVIAFEDVLSPHDSAEEHVA